jgi:hypothetical protein
MAAFALANTTDPDIAGLCAQQLPHSVRYQIVPKVVFDPAWVLGQGRDLNLLAYAVRYCDDADVLDAVCKRDKRKEVRKALANNKHLSSEAKETLSRESAVLGLVIAKTGDDPEEKLKWFLKFISSKKGYIHFDRKGVVGLLGEHERDMPDGPTTAILALGRLECYGYMINEYLRVVYSLNTDMGQKERDVWGRVSRSPAEVLSSLKAKSCEKVLVQFLEDIEAAIAGANAPLEIKIDAAVVKLMMQHVAPGSKKKTPKMYHNLFSQEGIDLLLESPQWLRIIVHQSLNDEQFSRLVQVTPARWRKDLFGLLGGDRKRLVILVNAMGTSRAVITGAALSNATRCLEGSDDKLLEWLIPRVNPEYDLANYLLGGWNKGGGPGNILRPPVDKVGSVIRRLRLSAPGSGVSGVRIDTTQFAKYLVADTDDVNAGEWAMPQGTFEALLDTIPGLAYSARNGKRVGLYLFSRFESAGAPIEQALAQFEAYGPEASFSKICTTLRALARGYKA